MKKCFLNNFYFCNKSHLTIKQSVYNKRHEIKKALAYQVIEKNRDYKSIGILIKKRMVFKMKKLDVYLSNLLVGNVKLHNLHWNVVGSSFKQAHEYLEEVYDDFFGKFDDVAEYQKQVGVYPKSSVKEYLELTDLEELSDQDIDLKDAYKEALKLIKHMRDMALEIRDEADDFVLSNMMEDHIADYYKRIWLLESAIK